SYKVFHGLDDLIVFIRRHHGAVAFFPGCSAVGLFCLSFFSTSSLFSSWTRTRTLVGSWSINVCSQTSCQRSFVPFCGNASQSPPCGNRIIGCTRGHFVCLGKWQIV